MPDAVFIGPAAVPPLLIATAVAVTAGGIFLHFFIRSGFPREAEWLTNRATTAFLAGLLTWKLWPLLRWWDAIRDQPAILLRIPGGTSGTVAGLIVASAIILPGMVRVRTRVRPALFTLLVGVVTFFFSVAVLQTVSGSPDHRAVTDARSILTSLEYLQPDIPGALPSKREVPLVLTFWATWCAPCAAELPIKDAFYRAYGGEIDYIAVNLIRTESSRAAVADFVARNGMQYPVALDTNGEVRARFGVRGTPTTVVIDSDGEIIARRLGPASLDWLERSVAVLLER